MSNTFNIKRFGKYITHTLSNAWSDWGITFLIIAGAPLLAYLIYLVFNLAFGTAMPSAAFRFGLFCGMIIAYTLIAPGKLYGLITDKRYGSVFLSVPASHLEKYITMILVTTIVTPCLVVAGFLGIDAILCTLDPRLGECVAKICIISIDPEFEESVSILGNGYPIMVLLWIQALLAFLLGAIFFKKNSAGKTILVLIGLSILFGFLCALIVPNFDFEDLGEAIIERPSFYINLFLHIVIDVPIIIFLILIWFRLKTLKH